MFGKGDVWNLTVAHCGLRVTGVGYIRQKSNCVRTFGAREGGLGTRLGRTGEECHWINDHLRLRVEGVDGDSN